MTKLILTHVAENGDVHLEFSGFLGRVCEVEEERVRRELAALGVNVRAKVSRKALSDEAETCQQVRAARTGGQARSTKSELH